MTGWRLHEVVVPGVDEGKDRQRTDARLYHGQYDGDAAMAGYALAKKRFMGRALLFSLIVCAMALPKQVILIPLLKETGLEL